MAFWLIKICNDLFSIVLCSPFRHQKALLALYWGLGTVLVDFPHFYTNLSCTCVWAAAGFRGVKKGKKSVAYTHVNAVFLFTCSFKYKNPENNILPYYLILFHLIGVKVKMSLKSNQNQSASNYLHLNKIKMLWKFLYPVHQVDLLWIMKTRVPP